MRHAILFLALSTFSIAVAAGQQTQRYEGTLVGDLVLARTNGYSGDTLHLLDRQQRNALSFPLSPESQAYLGKLIYRNREVPVLWVETSNQPPVVYVDTDLDGKLSAKERFAFHDVTDDESVLGEVALSLPLPGKRYAGYPVRIIRPNPARMPIGSGTTRALWFQSEAYARGVVDIDGRRVLVQYALDQESGRIVPTTGTLGVDTNGDGTIDLDPLSPETAFAEHETVVFRVGDRFVSTAVVDVDTGRIDLLSHPAADYRRIEVREGADLPDFSYTDLTGKQRRISELRGKYVLLDFWATWCHPCVAEIPNLKAAYSTFRARGFEIVGLSGDESSDVVKQFAAERGIVWTQATPESTTDLIKKQFRISSWPTTILIDPKGRVLSRGGRPLPLRGAFLAKTLESLLPANPE